MKQNKNIEKWKLTGLLQGLRDRSQEIKATADCLEKTSEYINQYQDMFGELSVLLIPLVRVLADVGFYPEGRWLCDDFYTWYQYDCKDKHKENERIVLLQYRDVYLSRLTIV